MQRRGGGNGLQTSRKSDPGNERPLLKYFFFFFLSFFLRFLLYCPLFSSAVD